VEDHAGRSDELLLRAVAAGLVPEQPLQLVWAKVLADVEVPRAGVVHRLLHRLGVNSSDSLVMASAGTFRVAWLLGVIGVLFFTVVATWFGPFGGIGLFVLGAPLVPVAGVDAAYGPSVDPSYEAVLVTPYTTVRLIHLILLRTAFVLVTSVPLVVVAGLLLPASPIVAMAWLLPAAGFVVVVIDPLRRWVELLPLGDIAHPGRSVALWIAVVAGCAVVTLACTRDPGRPGVARHRLQNWAMADSSGRRDRRASVRARREPCRDQNAAVRPSR